MNRRSISALIIILILLASLIGFIDVEGKKTVSTDDDIIEYSEDGLRYNGHEATKDEINDMRASLGVKEAGKNYNVMVDGHGTGLAPPTEKQWDDLEGDFILDSVEGTDLTASTYDISQQSYFPEIRSQGSQGSCSAWAVTYYSYGYLEAKDRGWSEASSGNNDQLMSPAWTYNKVNGGTDEGSSLLGCGNLVKDWGSSTWAKMPYDDDDAVSWGNDYAFREAPSHRAQSAHHISYSGDGTVDTVKNLISSDTPVNFAIDGSAYNLTDNYVMSSVEYDGGTPNHAQTFVGYDDSITEDGETGAFKVANSWGKAWGDDGYYWITYDTFKEMGSDMYLTYIEDRQDYEPSLLGIWHFNSKPTRDSTIELGVGDPSSLDDDRSPYFVEDGSHTYPDFLCLDISEFEDEFDSGIYDFYLDMGSSSSDGDLSSFKIEHYDGNYDAGNPDQVTTQAAGLPKNTPCQSTNTLNYYPPISNKEAVDNSNLEFTLSGPAEWTGVNQLSSDGSDSLQSGDIGDGYSSTIETQVDGKGILNFMWKVSSSSDDLLRFYLDGSLEREISGVQDWNQEEISLSTGSHILKWVYTKDSSISQNEDAGWLDEVQLTSGNQPPDQPTDPSPSDEERGVNTSTEVSVFVSDPDGDTLDVSFYDASDDTLIGTDSVQSGSRAVITWDGLYKASEHGWYAVADDGASQTISPSWSFYTLDDIDPTVEITFPEDDKKISKDEITVEWNGSDEGFGIDHYELMKDSGSWVNVGSNNRHTLSSISEGDHEVVVKAVDEEGNTGTENVSFYVDTVPPEIIDNSPNDTEDNNYTFNVSVSDSTGVASVNLYYYSEELGPYNVSMDPVGRGYYEKDIELPYQPIKIFYNISSEDTVGNWNQTGQRSISISDDIAPEIIDKTVDKPETGDTFTVRVNVTDNFELDKVKVTYSTDVTGEKNEHMDHISGNDYVLNMDIPDSATEFYYNISAEDSAGNTEFTGIISFDVVDDDSPTINYNGTEIPTTGEIWHLSIEIEDNIEVQKAAVEYYTDVTPSNTEELIGDGGEYILDISIPADATVFYYNITAEDTSENVNYTGLESKEVIDNDVPVYQDNSQSSATTGDNFTFDFTADDNIGIERLKLTYWTDVSSGHTKRSDGASLIEVIELPSDASKLYYNLTAEDQEGNLNFTGKIIKVVKDDDPPSIKNVTAKTPITGENCTLTAGVTDNIGVDKVLFVYSIDDGRTLNRTLNETGTGSYDVDLKIPENATYLRYTFIAIDNSGNEERLEFSGMDVVDSIPPIADAGADRNVSVDEELKLSGRSSTDNIGIVNYTWLIENKEFSGSNLSYNFTEIGTYNIYLNVSDGNGNYDVDVLRIEVKDMTSPVADAGSDRTIYTDETLELDAGNSTDNCEIAGYIWSIDGKTYEGERVNISLGRAGTFVVKLSVKDVSGNYGSDNITLTVEERPPGELSVESLDTDADGNDLPVSYTIDVRIENTGGKPIEWQLKIDGEVVEEGTLEPSEDEEINYSGQFDEAGEHEVSIGDKTETIQIEEEKEEQPSFTSVLFLFVLVLAFLLKNRKSQIKY